MVLAHVTVLVLSVESSDKEETYMLPRSNIITVSTGRARVFSLIVEKTVECFISFHRSVFSCATWGKPSTFPCCIARVFPPSRLQHKVEQSVHVLMPRIVEETVKFFISFHLAYFSTNRGGVRLQGPSEDTCSPFHGHGIADRDPGADEVRRQVL